MGIDQEATDPRVLKLLQSTLLDEQKLREYFVKAEGALMAGMNTPGMTTGKKQQVIQLMDEFVQVFEGTPVELSTEIVTQAIGGLIALMCISAVSYEGLAVLVETFVTATKESAVVLQNRAVTEAIHILENSRNSSSNPTVNRPN